MERKSLEYLQSLITKDALILRHSSGVSYAQIARELDITEAQIKNLLLSYQLFGDDKTSKVKRFIECLSYEDFKELCYTYSAVEAAEKLKVSINFVKSACIYYNIKISPKLAGEKSAKTKSNMSEERKALYRERLRIKTKNQWLQRPPDKRKEILEKALKTKKENSSFNLSKPEINFYTKLCEIYEKSDIKTQYKNQLYPFNCDFYIESADLYIELNLFWMHGRHLFNSQNKNDIMEMNLLWYKANQSYLFLKKLDTWTNKDPQKIECAIKNKLNYIAIYEDCIYATIDKIELPIYNNLPWNKII